MISVCAIVFRILAVLAAICGLAASTTMVAHARQDVREAIVKIYTTYDKPDYYDPWRMHGARSATGSGCIISGNRILTNAHVISDQTFVQVRRYGQARRVRARVLSISHHADLALLTVDDTGFFAEVEPLEFGELPEVQQEVHVYGFPLGGDMLSTTKGVVSRIEHRGYEHSSADFLAGQLDAAVNPGNSGGPVIINDRIVGVIMQSIPGADNIGYMVPVPIIDHFLKDIEDGAYDGFPILGVVIQGMENPGLKDKYGMPKDQTGVLVIRVHPGSPADGRLEVGDVVMSIEGHPIADDGTVEFRSKERTSASVFVDAHQIGDTIDLGVLRKGTAQTVGLTLTQSREKDWLIPMEQYEVKPTYYIYGGLVFCPLTKNLLKAWGNNWGNNAPKTLVSLLSANYPSRDIDEIVLLLKVQAAEVNEGYHEIGYWIIDQVNGTKIRGMKDLVRALESESSDSFAVVMEKNGYQIVIDREKVSQTHQKILETYNIPRDRSDDLNGL